jgi:predicted nucleotidyltransferase
MGSPTALTANDRAVRAFARRLHAEGAERVLLFGSHATGRAAPDSDYDLIVVDQAFDEIPRLKRHFGMHDLFYEVGGNAPLDLILLTPEEFEWAKGRVTLVASVLPEAIDLLAEATAPG